MNYQIQTLKVKDVMRPAPLTVDEETTVETVFQILSEQSLPCIPVVDAQKRLQGCIFLSDIQKVHQLFDLKEYLGIILSGLDPKTQAEVASAFAIESPINLFAREVMSVKPLVVDESESISNLSRLMIEQSSVQALVIDQNQHVTGIVSTFDILKAL